MRGPCQFLHPRIRFYINEKASHVSFYIHEFVSALANYELDSARTMPVRSQPRSLLPLGEIPDEEFGIPPQPDPATA